VVKGWAKRAKKPSTTTEKRAKKTTEKIPVALLGGEKKTVGDSNLGKSQEDLHPTRQTHVGVGVGGCPIGIRSIRGIDKKTKRGG